MTKMLWDTLLRVDRFKKNQKQEYNPLRSVFQQDYDRIAFSPSFRRLGKKTQVHPLSSNDHIHNRLTHSLEVASSGRSIGAKVGDYILKNYPHEIDLTFHDTAMIVQAACLAHDIGNPPFGHAGEEAIKSWFCENDQYLQGFSEEERNDFIYWEGNAQALRVVIKIENKYYGGGMQLTYPVLGALMKYPYISCGAKSKKFGCFWSERDDLKEIALNLGLIKLGPTDYYWCRHPFAYLSEAADDICYKMTDIEDACELGILRMSETTGIFKDFIDSSVYQTYKTLTNDQSICPRRRLSPLRALFINACIEQIAQQFIANVGTIMEGAFARTLIDAMSGIEKDILMQISQIYQDRIFKETHKVELEIGVHSLMDILLTNFCTAAREMTQGSKVSFKTQKLCELMGETAVEKGQSTFDAYHRVLDYISGMTDNYAVHIASQLSGTGR